MLYRPALAAALLFLAGQAQAFTEVGASLPTFAANSQLSERASGQWSAFSPSGAAFNFSSPGFSGFMGARTSTAIVPLSKNVTLGVQSISAYTPFTRGAAVGQEFSGTNFQFNYNMGRMTPFAAGSIVSTRPALPGGLNFGLPGVSLTDVKTSATIGAGFNYAVTEKFSFGVTVSAGTGQGFR